MREKIKMREMGDERERERDREEERKIEGQSQRGRKSE